MKEKDGIQFYDVYNCLNDCKYLLVGGGEFDNPAAGGCSRDGEFPENTTFEVNDESYPLCPKYEECPTIPF